MSKSILNFYDQKMEPNMHPVFNLKFKISMQLQKENLIFFFDVTVYTSNSSTGTNLNENHLDTHI